jgi:hypothetical protein
VAAGSGARDGADSQLRAGGDASGPAPTRLGPAVARRAQADGEVGTEQRPWGRGRPAAPSRGGGGELGDDAMSGQAGARAESTEAGRRCRVRAGRRRAELAASRCCGIRWW